MVIYMDKYRKSKATHRVTLRRYSDEAEALCVNWNPAIGVIAMSCYLNSNELSPQLPEDFSNVNVTEFLDRVYALSSQI